MKMKLEDFFSDNEDNADPLMTEETREKMEGLGKKFYDDIMLALGIDLSKKPTPETTLKAIGALTFLDAMRNVTTVLTIQECTVMLDIVSQSMKDVIKIHKESKEKENDTPKDYSLN